MNYIVLLVFLNDSLITIKQVAVSNILREQYKATSNFRF